MIASAKATVSHENCQGAVHSSCCFSMPFQKIRSIRVDYMLQYSCSRLSLSSGHMKMMMINVFGQRIVNFFNVIVVAQLEACI